MKEQTENLEELQDEIVDNEEVDEVIDNNKLMAYDIAVFYNTYNLSTLIKWWNNKLIVPDFQRSYVWNQKKASEFVDSMLRGLPVPSMFFYDDIDNSRLLVVDGQQRLRSLYLFIKEKRFGDQVFKLMGNIHPKWQGKCYDELEPEDRDRLEDALMNITVVSVNVSAFRNKILELSRKNEVSNSIVVTNPELAKEWNYGKNGLLKPEMFTSGSNEKVWWKCKVGHEWQAMIVNRARNKTGCPICAGKQILVGYNDLETVNQKLSQEWNYEKNGDLKPTDVTCGSGKKVWWKCHKGHEWQATIASRNRGNGCPICSGKQFLSIYDNLEISRPDLVTEWNYEKNGDLLPSQVTCGSNKKVWWKCHKGHEWQATVSSRNSGKGCPICSGREVLSGYSDLATLRPDLAKEWDYEKNGDLLPTQVKCGSKKKVWWKCHKGHEWQATVGDRNNGYGCPVCSGKQVLAGYNDLASKRPDLAKEWDYDKNGDLLPSQVTCGSNKKVWWKCKKGHIWQAQINKRNYGKGCPVCAGQQVLAGYNDLAFKRPDLAKEWNYEKNDDLLPSQVMCGSDKKVWWKCSICGYEWLARIANRTKGRGCPACAKKIKK